jgi:hypothetical protein
MGKTGKKKQLLWAGQKHPDLKCFYDVIKNIHILLISIK